MIQKVSAFSQKTICIIFAFFCAMIPIGALIFTPFGQGKWLYISLAGAALLCLAAYATARHFPDFLTNISTKKWLILLTLTCIAVKLLWVILVRIEPHNDYARFYETAIQLSESYALENAKFFAIFPHILGYASFLSLFFSLFGAGTLWAPLLNVGLTTISMLLIYYICDKLCGKKMAVIACLLWTILPSQTIYNMFALSEPLYTTLLLCIWALFLLTDQKMRAGDVKKGMAGFFMMGIVAAVLNTIRPIGLIVLISIVMYFFILTMNSMKDKKILWTRLSGALAMLVLYFALSFGSNLYIESRVGEPPVAVSGYNMYVGFNVSASGLWNEEDSALFYSYVNDDTLSAVEVQEKMFAHFEERILDGHINCPVLFAKKFNAMWSRDSACVTYMSGVIQAPETKTALNFLCNSFYYFLALCALAALWFVWKRREKPMILIVLLFFIGLVLAHMLVEVATRYHYSGMAALVIMAAYGIGSIKRKPSEDSDETMKQSERLQGD